MIVCSFSSGLDDLPRRDQMNRRKVLAHLQKRPRYSTFEATATPHIAKTLSALYVNGLIVPSDKKQEFPWHRVKLTVKGFDYLTKARS